MRAHSGPAKVFYTKKDLLNAIEAKKIVEGDVIVLPYQGPAGAPGMPEMLTPTDTIMGAGYKWVALITDGRFSGGTTGPCIGHIEREAYNGGTIGAIKDGDRVEIDIPNRKLNVKFASLFTFNGFFDNGLRMKEVRHRDFCRSVTVYTLPIR
jgi:dihydroxy-acid dehydratase